MNNQIPDNLLPTPTGNSRPPAVRTAHARTADILSAQASPTPAAQITRTADILSAQTGPTPAVQSQPANGLARRGWHSRGYLPHWDPGDRSQHLVFRLHDSLPQHLLDRWEAELCNFPEPAANVERRNRIEAALDQGMGQCYLRQPEVAQVVAQALLHFNGERYHLHAWVVMPNHVHTLITPTAPTTLASITHSWKSYTAKNANHVLGRQGQFWQKEYFDRAMEDAHDMGRTKTYIEANPVAAGLCQTPADWLWSSARTADIRTAAQTTRTADILSAQAGETPAVQPPTKAQRRTTVREPNLFDAAEAAE